MTVLRIPNFSKSNTIDQVGIEERCSRFQTRSIKKETKVQGLKMVLNMMLLSADCYPNSLAHNCIFV